MKDILRDIGAALVIILAVGIFAGCGDDGGTDAGDTGRPAVTQTNPADGATGISQNMPVWIYFSEPMDEASLDSIFIEGVSIAGREYDEDSHVVTLWLSDLLDEETEYEVRVAEEVMDMAGNEMESDYTFSYTTGTFSPGYLYDPFAGNFDIAHAADVETDTGYWLVPSCWTDTRFDFYRFTLADTAKVTASVDYVYGNTPEMRWGISYLRADEESYASTGTGARSYPSNISFNYSFLPGTYYAKIYKYESDAYCGVYNFTLETSEPCPDDEYEDNDFPDEAKPITAGLHEGLRGCFVDQDFYSIEMAQGKTLKVTMTEVSSVGGSRMLYITGPGVSVGGINQVEPRVEMVLAQAGTYTIRTRWWADGVTYDLNIEVLD